jgi:hypothetical protein
VSAHTCMICARKRGKHGMKTGIERGGITGLLG